MMTGANNKLGEQGSFDVRGICAAWLVGLTVVGCSSIATAAAPAFEISALDPTAGMQTADAIVRGDLEARFAPFDAQTPPKQPGRHWLRFKALQGFSPGGMPVFVVHKSRTTALAVYTSRDATLVSLSPATELPAFRGTHDIVYVLPDGLAAGQSLYLNFDSPGRGLSEVRMSASTLDLALARGAEHARMIALSFGALTSMALAALLIWLVLSDRLFVLYSSLFFLQALYLAYLSGQGFSWPVLSLALPVGSHAWNVPAGLSGAIACLFVREIADLRHFSPRVYAAFGWLAGTFAVLTLANVGKYVGLGELVNAIGNLIFLATAVFTLVVAFLAWRRGSRAAGWFLIAWGLLEACTIASVVQLLLNRSEESGRLLYYFALPLSMVSAAVFIALGVADRLREQRLALSEAERRAQTDPLTGVLNRRSLIERLEAAGVRARARGLPISILFIDLDHFKSINDSYGHQAGDACLRAVIGPIQAELRQSDVIGRFGGEEFVVILSSADGAAAHPIAERIRGRVEAVIVDGFGAEIRMTCSIGIAASDDEGAWGETLIARADEAVYIAKRSGRNQVRMRTATA